jgi:hypothetical protein
MKKVKAILWCLFLAPSFAYADWTVFSRNDGITFYYDKSTIKTDNQYKKVWTLIDFKEAKLNSTQKPFKSITTYWLLDCKQDRQKLLQLTQYNQNMADGGSVRTVSTPGDWEYVEPQSVANTLQKLICGG